MKKIGIKHLAISSLLLLLAPAAFAMTITNHSLVTGDFNGGGGSRSSAGYVMTVDAIGIGGHGKSSSMQYVMQGGSVPAVSDLDAPDTTLTANPPNPSNSISPLFTFISSEAGTFECRLDSGSFASCTSPLVLSLLSDGTHTFIVRAIDTAGNADPTPASYAWTIDATAPDTSITMGQPANPTNLTSANFSFSATETATFECQLDGGGYAACTSPQSYSSLADGSHMFMVRAKDALNNTDPTPASYTWTIDAINPVLIVSTLANGAVTNNPSLNVTGTVTDASGVQTLLISGVTVTVNPDNTFSYLVTLSTGSNTISTVATDLADNTITDTRVITLDQNGPALSIALPADNSITNQLVSTVTGTVDETSTVSVRLNNGTAQSASMTGTTFSASVNLASGMNTIDVTATDIAGNTSSGKRTVTSDPTAPSVAITSPAQDITSSQATITITGTVTDTLTQTNATISVDGIVSGLTVTTGSFTRDVAFTLEGLHTIIVTATDEAGNTSSVQRNINYVKFGDLDDDGDVDSVDALKALRIAAGIDTATAGEQSRGDVAPIVNGTPAPDGSINIGDVVVILRKAVGLVSW